MSRRFIPAAALALSLALGLCATSFASDMYPKPPVPSSRNSGKTDGLQKQGKPVTLNNMKAPDKITKTPKNKLKNGGPAFQ